MLIVLAAALAGITLSFDAHARIRVVTTLPSFADLAREVGGDDVDVVSLTKGTQDPHFVDAKPDLVLKLNKADLLLHAGLDLEIGWLPVLVTGSRNSKINAGSKGNLDCSTLVEVKDVPKGKVDRSMGDVHPGGNPHYMGDPRNGLVVAAGIANRLKEIDHEHAQQYDSRLSKYQTKLRAAIKTWESKMKPYQHAKVVTYHRSWIYFTDWLGLNEVGYVEPKPGVPPSPSHIVELVARIKNMNVKAVIAEPFYPKDSAEVVAKQANAAFVVLPSEVLGTPDAKTYIDLFDVSLGRLAPILGSK